MASFVENVWNSLRKSLGIFGGTFYTVCLNFDYFISSWWNSTCFSQVFQKFYAGLFSKFAPIFCDKMGGFTQFPHSLLLLLN